MSPHAAGSITTRWRAWLWALFFGCVLGSLSPPAFAGDPYLRYFTLSTPHFRVHYHGGLEAVAHKVAHAAESSLDRLAPQVGWTPHEPVHILVTDFSADANGSATVLPYNTIRLFVTAPDDMSPLNDYGDWVLNLVTHEQTHVLHLDNIRGLPALINSVLGKTYVPNFNQPFFILEGLATAMESEHTSAGRLRSSLFDMYLRTDVLEDQVLGLDQLSHSVRRFPGRTAWYLYGAYFVRWILDVYGPDTFAAVATDYGENLIPWGINRSIRRATGRTYPELYEGFKHALRRRYSAQVAAIRARGVRSGRRLTQHGSFSRAPRFVPRACHARLFPHVDRRAEEIVVYYRADGHSLGGFYALPLNEKLEPIGDSTLLSRSRDEVGSFDSECGFVFSSVAPTRRDYYFHDLFRQQARSGSSDGDEDGRVRLTQGVRARSPALDPKGKKVAFVTDRAGTTTLRLAAYEPQGGIGEPRLLVNKRPYEQVYTPRFSPDGRRIAYSTWLTGGYRDIHVIDIHSGRVESITHDRALDQQPVWSPDGKTLYFVSDRTGVANIYAYRSDTGVLLQVSNVLTGAYMPEPSEDGRWLIYAGYTESGFDLFSLALDESTWTVAEPYHDDRPAPFDTRSTPVWPQQDYSPLPTLRPYRYTLELDEGPFGTALTLQTSGQDITGRHHFFASLGLDFDATEPQAQLSYDYSELEVDVGLSAFRAAVPRRDYRVGDQSPLLREAITGASSGIGYTIPGEFDFHRLGLSYSFNQVERRFPVRGFVDPYEPLPEEPYRGILGVIHGEYRYADSYSSTYAVSDEGGWELSASFDYASEATASDDTLLGVTGRVRQFSLLPWGEHHVLASTLGAGTVTGSYPRRGFFAVGGFRDDRLSDVLLSELPALGLGSSLAQSPFKLRGYAPAQFIGRSFVQGSFEYRFPISYVERGLSTLPAFLDLLSGAVFVDYGGAFDKLTWRAQQQDLHLGVGAEFWVHLMLGYGGVSTLRLGWARGLTPAAPGLISYLALAARF